VLEIEGVVAEPYSFRHHQGPLLEAYDALKADANADISNIPERHQRWAAFLLSNEINPHDIPFVGPDEGMELSYQEILKVFELMDEDPTGKVFRGSPDYLKSLDEPLHSPAAEFIIERAMADDDRPLYIAAIGCVTNIASAILMEPEIIKRIVVTWTSSYPSHVGLSNVPSLNLMQDPIASQLLFDCGVPHVYLPGYYIGEQLKISLPEMETWVKGKGKIGDYLHYLYTHNPVRKMRGIDDHFGRTWVMWDIINIAWMLDPEWVPSHLVKSPILTDDLFFEQGDSRHLMREAYGINRDAIFRDFFTKLEKAP